MSDDPSATGRAQDRESPPVENRRSTAVPRNQDSRGEFNPPPQPSRGLDKLRRRNVKSAGVRVDVRHGRRIADSHRLRLGVLRRRHRRAADDARLVQRSTGDRALSVQAGPSPAPLGDRRWSDGR